LHISSVSSVSTVPSTKQPYSGGLIGDHIGRLNLLIPMVSTSGLLCFPIWLPAQSLILVVLFACLFGFTSGFFISLLPAIVSQITSDDKIGARIGAFYGVTAVASLIGAPIGGILAGKDGEEQGYRWLIVYAVSVV
jgi:MCP family monocarboxylic acid transporter-like MFS transporter 10